MTEGAYDPRAVVTLQSSEENATVELIGLRDPTAGPPASRWLLMARADRASRGSRAAGGGDAGVDDLRAATAIAQLWRLPSELVDPQRLLGQMTSVVRSAIQSAATVSITLGDPVAPDRLASDSADAQHLDGLQFRLGVGPCVNAYRESAAVVVADLATDLRWPRLAAASRGQSLHSVLALPIRLSDTRAGVITVYGREPGVFGERSVRTGELISAAVAAVLRGAEERASLQNLVHHLERALSSRATIEQAKGIVMAHFGGTADEAFARLVAYSSTHNTKLRDVAALIVEGGGGSPVGEL
jgi:GAF domain-containing protein